MAAFLEGLLAGKTWSSELLETLHPGFGAGQMAWLVLSAQDFISAG